MITLQEVKEELFTSLGKITTLFMSNPQPGTQQVMPATEVTRIGEELMEKITAYGKAQRKEEILSADDRLKNEYGEDWLSFRDDRLKELE